MARLNQPSPLLPPRQKRQAETPSNDGPIDDGRTDDERSDDGFTDVGPSDDAPTDDAPTGDERTDDGFTDGGFTDGGPSDDAAHESDVRPLERVHASSDPTQQSLMIEVQSKLDLEQVVNSTDVAQFLATSDLNQALKLGKQIIIKRSQILEVVSSQSAWDISMVWKAIQKFQIERPEKSATIRHWQTAIDQQLQEHNNKAITYFLLLAEKTVQRLSAYEKRIYDSWGVLPSQVLPKDKYNADRPLSKTLLQNLATLTEYISLEEGQRMLSESIEKRSNKSTRSAYDRRKPYLVVGDVRTVVEKQQTRRKRSRDEEAEDADNADGTVVRAESRSVKRQKRSRSREDEVVDEEEDREEDEDIDDHEDETNITSRVPPTGGDIQGDPRRSSSPLSSYPTNTQKAEERAAEEDAAQSSSPTSSTREMLDDDDGQQFSDVSIELPLSAPAMPYYQSPTSPHQSPTSPHQSPTLPHQSPAPPNQSPTPPHQSTTLSHLIRRMSGRQSGRNSGPRSVPKHADSALSPVDATHGAEAVATTDFSMELATLQPGHKLSSTVIQETLAFCAPADSHLIDPLYFNSDFPDRSGLSRHLAPSIRRVFIPLHNRRLSHWTLAVLNLESRSIFLYDSLRYDQTAVPPVAQRLQRFGAGISGRPQDWTYQSVDCPKQSNETDCGVHVIANAAFLMICNKLPQSHDCNAWRLICRAVLGETFQDIHLDTLERFRSPAEIRDLREVAGIHPFQLPNLDEPSLVMDLGEVKQVAQNNLLEVQGQQYQLRILRESAMAIVNVLEAVHRRLATEMLFLSDQFIRNEQLLADHAAFIERHHVRPDATYGQDDFAIIQATQGSEDLFASLCVFQKRMTEQVEQKVAEKEVVRNQMLKSKSLASIAKRIRARYAQEFDLSESARRQIRGKLQQWRDILTEALSGVDEALAL